MLFPLSLAVSFAQATEYVILNAKRDIEDLDVGDLSDMTIDVSPMFLEKLKYGGEQRHPTMIFVTLNSTSVQGIHATKQLGSDWSVSDKRSQLYY